MKKILVLLTLAALTGCNGHYVQEQVFDGVVVEKKSWVSQMYNPVTQTFTPVQKYRVRTSKSTYEGSCYSDMYNSYEVGDSVFKTVQKYVEDKK